MRYIWYIWFGVLIGNSTAAPTLLSELSWTTVCLLDFTVQKKHAKTLLIWWSRTSLIKRKFEIIKSWWENPLLVLLSESDLQSFSYALTYLLEFCISPHFLSNYKRNSWGIVSHKATASRLYNPNRRENSCVRWRRMMIPLVAQHDFFYWLFKSIPGFYCCENCQQSAVRLRRLSGPSKISIYGE